MLETKVLENLKMTQENTLDIRNGRQVYVLYSSQEPDSTCPIGFIGKMTNIRDNPLNVEFSIRGHELLLMDGFVSLELNLCPQKDAPKFLVARAPPSYIGERYLQNGLEKVELTNNPGGPIRIKLGHSLPVNQRGLLDFINARGYAPNPSLYEDIRKAMRNIRVSSTVFPPDICPTLE